MMQMDDDHVKTREESKLSLLTKYLTLFQSKKKEKTT